MSKSPAPLPPEDPAAQVSAGLARMAATLREKSWEGATALGLNPTQGSILAALHQSRPDPLRLNEVAATLGVTAATASDSVRVLEEKGLITRGRARDDARAISITLTASGRRMAAQAVSWAAFLGDAATSLPGAGQAALLRALARMQKVIESRSGGRPAPMCVTCRHFNPAAGDPFHPRHYCEYFDMIYGDTHLRLDCPAHDPAPEVEAAAIWERFVSNPVTG